MANAVAKMSLNDSGDKAKPAAAPVAADAADKENATPAAASKIATSSDEIVVRAQRSAEERERAEAALLCSIENKEACTMCSS